MLARKVSAMAWSLGASMPLGRVPLIGRVCAKRGVPAWMRLNRSGALDTTARPGSFT